MMYDNMRFCKICVFLVIAQITGTSGQGLIGVLDSTGLLVWKDEGSGADDDFSSWSSSMFKTIYHHGQRHWNYMNKPILTVQPYQDPDALAIPTGFDWIWNDAGSGADADVTIWRVLCPDGYVSLGDVTYPAHGDPPAVLYETTRCVKRTYAYECEWLSDIWTDRGSGAYNDVKVVEVSCSLVATDENNIGTILDHQFKADHFYAVDSYDGLPNVTPYGLRTDRILMF